jgi:serine phosphatase RsbU (regulator of sigma subunit)
MRGGLSGFRGSWTGCWETASSGSRSTAFRLAGGDVLLLYTDGATDARPRSANGDTSPLFGQDGLAAALAGYAGLDADGVIARLTGILAKHSGDWASDDTSLLALRVPPGTRP